MCKELFFIKKIYFVLDVFFSPSLFFLGGGGGEGLLLSQCWIRIKQKIFKQNNTA